MSVIRKVIEIVGDQKQLAAKLDVSPGFVSHMANGRKQVPVRLCPKIEKIVEGQVTCSQLRPDVFGESAA